MKLTRERLKEIIKEELQSVTERCWDGYERVPGTKEGAPGSCRKKGSVNEGEADLESKIRKVLKDEGGAAGMEALIKGTKATEDDIKNAIKGMDDVGVHKDGDYIADDGDNIDVVGEGKICDKGISYVIRTDPGGKDIKRGEDGKLKNWSARAAQIASKYCKDPDYGKGRGKDAKDENIEEAEGGLKAWEKENWVHSDGRPCGSGDKDGSKSRCKPASKWKTMSKKEKKADDAKKAKGTKAGKQYVPATKKGKVTKAHTKREGMKMDRQRLTEIINEEFENAYYEYLAEGETLEEAEYQGRKVTLNKPMKGDVKKSKVYVKNKKGNVVKVNFGDPNMKIRKSNPEARKSFRARHNCADKMKNPDKTTAGYWSCKAW